ncbi:MAG: Nif3-like dinuclear metal center hexameric protein [Bacteroidota bacterium]|nr:Nif3-like dinuclear metal center hexameric protein [Bacteroidota bacterium]
MKLREITGELERIAPLSLQEDYDNAGLLIGNEHDEINKALICLDVTDQVLEEALQQKCGLIISHHPLIFGGIKRLNGNDPVERLVIKAIQNRIAIYAIHTNIDNISGGVNMEIANRLGLKNTEVLKPKKNLLRKLVTFCPAENADQVRQAMFDAGAGHIGNYDCCSYNIDGKGSFRAGEGSDPHVGEINKLHFEKETRIEIIYPLYLEERIIRSMIAAHPYEEVAYDIYPLENTFNLVGSGIIGDLEEKMDKMQFLELLKEKFQAGCVKFTGTEKKEVGKIALCGGAGSFLIRAAKARGADVFISGDIKYHDFFLSDKSMMIVDIGHYESEQYTKELIFTVLKQKFPTFALQISNVNTNPVNYL